MILRTPVHFTARTALPGFFAMVDFVLLYVTLCGCFLFTDDIMAVRSDSLPYGASNPNGEGDEASPGRDEGARAGTNTLSQTLNQFTS